MMGLFMMIFGVVLFLIDIFLDIDVIFISASIWVVGGIIINELKGGK